MMHHETLPSSRPGCAEQLWYYAFALLALLVFWPAREAGFVTDWIGGQERYETGTFGDALRSFGWYSMLPTLFLLNFSLFKLFGAWWLPWYLIFTLLHGANGWYLYRLIRRVLAGHGGANAEWVALGAGALFLLSPYAAEPVVWKGCLQYMLSLLLLLVGMHRLIDYFEKPDWRQALWVNGALLLSFYLTEWNIVAPLLFLGFTLVYAADRRQWRALGPRLRWFALPQMGLVALWFGLNKYFLGHWVGHYGASTHLRFEPQLILATLFKYLAKYALFARYFQHANKNALFDAFDQPAVFWSCTAALGLLLGLWWLNFRKLNARLRWAGAGLLAFFVALGPFANLFFYYLQWSENDRYGYYAAGFFWMAVLLVLAALPRRLFRVLLVALLLLSTSLLWRTTRTWGKAEKIYAGLVQDFRWYDKDEVILLVSPDNLKGVPIARIIGQQSGFDEALALRRRTPFKGKMWEVVQYNMEYPADGIRVETDSTELNYTIGFRQDGNWFWRNGVGATDFETERYIFRKKEWDAVLSLREKRPNTAVIYPVGDRWEEVPAPGAR